jgi:chitosanase
MLCLVSLSCAASNNTTNLGSYEDHHGSIAEQVGQSTSAVNFSNKATDNTATEVAGAVNFTPIQTTGNCVDNTKKVAVYMASTTNPVYSESTNAYVNVPVTYDPLTASMFFEYNPDYLGDFNIESNLTTANYGLLIVPMSQMSTTASSAISKYIANGGSVWFLNDPCLTPTGNSSVQLTDILGKSVSITTSNSTAITVVNTDSVTSGLPASFKPVGTTTKTSMFRSLSGSGTIAGMNYQVLMSSGTASLLVKFENPTTGARVIYSNPNMFISGGTSSYFNSQTASQLFLQTKAWIMKLAQNPSGVEITYPGSDKQFLVTVDDVEASEGESETMSPMFSVEEANGLTPSSVNTFYIIPSNNTFKEDLENYSLYGDTHTIHAHAEGDVSVWDVASTDVSTYKQDINNSKNTINRIMGMPNYGFSSWRFPMTTFCANSMQAVSNSGFTIESSSGIGTDGIQIGNAEDNTVLFPKHLLVNNAKTGLIEMEMPAPFDIDCESGTDFYNQYNEFTSQFKDGNFPMNFVVGCHYQGVGTGGLPSWGVNVTGLTDGLGNIIAAEKAANPEYATMDTLARYINGIKSTKIIGYVSGSTTTVTVTNTQTITNFTLKSAFGNVVSATCDGMPVTIKKDATTGSSYITQTIKPGTHKFMISELSTSVQPTSTSAKNAMLQMTTALENHNTSLQWNYAENLNDGRGITFGIVGFCTGTYDGNMLIKYYTTLRPNNTLAKYIPALDAIDEGPHNVAGGDGNPSVVGLTNFITDVQDCNDPLFKQAQLYMLDQLFYNPAVTMFNSIGAKNTLTLAFIYDTNVRNGVLGAQSIINETTSALGGTPKTGVDENTYLSKMITLRDAKLKSENLGDVDRDAGYKDILTSGNVNLSTPFKFTANGDSFIINGDIGADITEDLGTDINTKSALTSTAESTAIKSPGFEVFFGTLSLLAIFLHKRK